MPQDQIEEIKLKTNIVDIVGEYVDLKKSGTNYKGLCPFHNEKTPSFMVSAEIQIFKCFGCGVGGDVYKFLMEIEKIEFVEALKILADKAGVKLEQTKTFSTFKEKEELFAINNQASKFYHYILTVHELGKPGREYLENRGVSDELIKEFQLGYSPDKPDTLFNFLKVKGGIKPDLIEKAGLIVTRGNQHFDRFRGRLMFPLKDHHGNIAGFSGRVIGTNKDIAKYINSPETLIYKKSQILYGLDKTKQDIKKSGFAVVVEGEFDLITSWKVGVKNVVAIKGSAFTTDQAELISRFCPRVYLALDTDFAGDKAARRGIEVLQKHSLEIRVVVLDKHKDPDEAGRLEPEDWIKAVNSATSIYDFLINSAFLKNDTNTIEGKAKISRELSPVLQSIEDEIIKSFCIKKVAQKLGVSEESVRAEAEKHKIPVNFSIEKKTTSPTQKTYEYILEERLLGLILQKQINYLKTEGLVDKFETPIFKKIIEGAVHSPGSSNASQIAKNLPPELQESFATLMLNDLNIQDEDSIVAEIEETQKKLNTHKIRRQLEKLKTDMANTEDSEIEKLLLFEHQLKKLTQNLFEEEAN